MWGHSGADGVRLLFRAIVGWFSRRNAPGKTSSSDDQRTRSLMETALTRRTWIEILQAAKASCQGCGGMHCNYNSPHSIAETRFELPNNSNLV